MGHGNFKCIFNACILPVYTSTQELHNKRTEFDSLCPTCLSTSPVSAVLNYTHIPAAHGFRQPMHINCSIQKQNWERHVGMCMERGAELLKFMYCSAWFPKPCTGTLSHRRLHHCLREREELGQNCSTVWFHCWLQLFRHARHKPKNLACWVSVPANPE